MLKQGLRVSVLLAVFLLAQTVPAASQAVRLSKSASVYLADIQSQAITGRLIYLPAGMAMQLYDKIVRKNARKWALALTENGIFAYVRADGVHFFNPAQIAVMQRPSFAIVLEPFPLTVEGIPGASLSPSEIYPVDKRFDFTTAILVGKEKFPSLGDDVLRIQVPEESLRVFEAEEMADLAKPIRQFRRKTFAEDLARLRDALVEGGIDQNARDKVISFLDRKLITEKACEQEIAGEIGVSGELEVKISGILSPLDAKFGGSGALKSSFLYERKSSFVIDRFAQDLEGGGELVIEVKNEELRDDCAAAVKSRRFVISTSRGESAEISAATIQDLRMRLVADGYIEVRCRAEFLKLFNELTLKYGLERDTAFLFLTYFTRFTGSSDPSTCAA